MTKPARLWLMFLAVLLTGLAGCASKTSLPIKNPTPSPVTTLTPWVFQTPTSKTEPTLQPAAAVATRTATPTPAITPAAWRPSLPALAPPEAGALKAISGQVDLAHLVELARWGRGSILYLDYSPDGRRLALATRRGISIVDSLTLREERFIEVTGGVPMLAVSLDGRFLAAASWASRLTLYDFAKGTPLRTLDNGDLGAPLALRFLSDGRTLSVSTTGEINLMWEVETGKLVHRWYTTGNSAMAASPVGDVMATSDFNGNIFLWSSADGHSTGKLWRDAEVQALRFSPDGTLIAAAYGDGRAGVWDLLKDAKMSYSLPHADRVSALAFSPDGNMVATGGWDNKVRLWRTSDGLALRNLDGMEGRVQQVLFSPDGSSLAVLAGDGVLRVWRIYDGVLAAQSLEYMGLRQAVFIKTGELVAAGDDSSLQFWNLVSGARRELPAAQPGGMDSLAASPDGRWLATSGMDGSLRAWSLPDLDLALELGMDEGWVNCLAFSADARYLAACAPGMVRVWSLPQGDGVGEIETGADNALRLVFTPDNQMLAVGTQDGNLTLWRISGSSPLKTLREEGKFINALALGAGGQTLASGGDESEISIWRVYNATLALTVAGKKDDRLSTLAYSADGQLIAAAWWDGSLRFYRADNGMQLQSLQFSAPVRRVEFSADGKMLALSLDDGTVRVWGVK